MGRSKMVRVTREDLVNGIAGEFDMTKEKAKRVINALFGAITVAAKEGALVTINGFGRFKATEGGGYERQGHNIPRTKRLTFVCSKNQKAEVE